MVAALLSLLSLLLAPASPALAQASPPSIEVALQRVLDSRVAALMSGDRQAFLATADQPTREAQGARFDGARSVGFSEYSLRLRYDLSGDLSTAAVRARYAPARAVVVQVDVRTRFGPYEDRPALSGDVVTFVEREGAWKVASDSDLEPVGLLSTRELWDLGPVVRNTSSRVMVLSHPDFSDQARAVVPVIEAAIAREQAGLDLAWPGQVVVIIPSSGAELGRLLQSTVDLDNFVGFAYWGADRDGPTGFDIAAPRVVLNPDTFFAFGDLGEDILTHELVHVATRGKAGPAVSSWLDEGLADFVATGAGTAGPPPDAAVPEDWRFGTGGGAAIRDAYGRSRSFVSFLARQGPGISAYYQAVGATAGMPGSRERLQDDAARRVFGASLSDLQAAWGRR